MGVIVGIDRFMSEARALTNFTGNAVATLLIGTWVGEFDGDRARAGLRGPPGSSPHVAMAAVVRGPSAVRRRAGTRVEREQDARGGRPGTGSGPPLRARDPTVEGAGAAVTPQDPIPVMTIHGEPVLGPTGRPKHDFPEPAPLTSHGPARIISMVNQKGGVGKTTSTINLGAALAGYGRRVLMVDFDPQGALSAGLGADPYELDTTVYNVLMERKVTARDAIMATEFEDMDLLPANIDLSAAEVQLVNEVAREQVLERALRQVKDDYDVVLIDCQPSLGLLTVNALTASDGVIIPLTAEFFALRAVALLVETIEKVQDRLNPDLEIDGVLATMFDQRTLHSKEVVGSLVDGFGDRVFETVIKRSIKFADATVAATPITIFAENHDGAKAYRQLARELISRGGAP